MSEYIPRLQEAIASAIDGVSREEMLRALREAEERRREREKETRGAPAAV